MKIYLPISRLLITVLPLMLLSLPAVSSIEITGPGLFKSRVQNYLNRGMQISVHTRRLIEAMTNSPMQVFITPISEDPSSWHSSGDRSRSHTRAVGSAAKAGKRQQPTSSTIYINEKRIIESNKSYARGTLIHELVHALDLAKGRYHVNYVIREKRAVFFQNIWRAAHGKTPRRHYHKRFATLEYQQAFDQGKIEEFVNDYFGFSDLR